MSPADASEAPPAPAATIPVTVAPRAVFGGREVVVIAGPCAVEGREMLRETALAVRAAGARMLRGGAWKPRTSPHSFQGLGDPGLALLVEAGREAGLPVVTEVVDPRQVEHAARHAHMLQVGSRNMQNYALLAEVGRAGVPVLLKRGFAATLKEFLLAAEHVRIQGNDAVVLCERGIRTFETSARFTLDLAAVPVLKRESHLPVIVDPSHAGGRADLVAPLARAGVAAGADGLIVEVHPAPATARSDADQALTPADFAGLMRQVDRCAAVLGRADGPAEAGA
jgi:3-deoxy-7-phosphoheptulonate synthase